MDNEHDVMAGYIHDAANIVTGLAYFAEKLQEAGLTGAVAQLAAILAEAQKHISPHTSLEIVHLGKRMDDLSQEIPELEQALRIKVSVTSDVQDGCSVHSDYDLARQVTRNILGNAAQAGATEVRIHYQEYDEYVTKVFSDNGPGMSPETLARVVLGQENGDRGLGILLIRRLIAKAGGTVHWDSSLGLGTWVTIKLRKVRIKGDRDE